MKILRVVSNLYPSSVGGVELHAHEMSRLQAEGGHNVTVLTYRTDSGQPSSEERNGYHILRSNAAFCLFGNTISFSQFFSLLKLWDSYDVVHAHSHLFFSTVLCTLARKFRSTPLVVTNHGLVSQTAPSWLQRLYLPTIGRWVFRSADAIICYTETEREQVVDLGVSPDKVHVLHNGIDTNVFVPSDLPSSKKQILWIGRFTPGKGVEYLLKGFQDFSREFPDYTLVMVGRGPLRDDFIRMIREMDLEDRWSSGISSRTRNSPACTRSRLSSSFQALRRVFQGQSWRRWPAGRPVVCTALPQLVDIVSGCGCSSPPEMPGPWPMLSQHWYQTRPSP
jgi:glycosyltransferase involved in cell wall biosynthesis